MGEGGLLRLRRRWKRRRKHKVVNAASRERVHGLIRRDVRDWDEVFPKPQQALSEKDAAIALAERASSEAKKRGIAMPYMGLGGGEGLLGSNDERERPTLGRWRGARMLAPCILPPARGIRLSRIARVACTLRGRAGQHN